MPVRISIIYSTSSIQVKSLDTFSHSVFFLDLNPLTCSAFSIHLHPKWLTNTMKHRFLSVKCGNSLVTMLDPMVKKKKTSKVMKWTFVQGIWNFMFMLDVVRLGVGVNNRVFLESLWSGFNAIWFLHSWMLYEALRRRRLSCHDVKAAVYQCMVDHCIFEETSHLVHFVGWTVGGVHAGLTTKIDPSKGH